jgi:hypothetical protein
MGATKKFLGSGRQTLRHQFEIKFGRFDYVLVDLVTFFISVSTFADSSKVSDEKEQLRPSRINRSW